MDEKPYQRVLIDDPSVGEPEVRLWRSVIMQAITDSLDSRERQAIIRWIPTKDFESVCQLAELEYSKLGPLLAKVVLGKKPQCIIDANRLKMLVWYGSIEIS